MSFLSCIDSVFYALVLVLMSTSAISVRFIIAMVCIYSSAHDVVNKPGRLVTLVYFHCCINSWITSLQRRLRLSPMASHSCMLLMLLCTWIWWLLAFVIGFCQLMSIAQGLLVVVESKKYF